MLTNLNAKFFDQNRKLRGIIGLTKNFKLIASTSRPGGRGSCRPHAPRNAANMIANFHSYAGFVDCYDSSVPSSDDMKDGPDGDIATPDRQLLCVGGQSGAAQQICGLGCLPQDPGSEPKVLGPIRQ